MVVTDIGVTFRLIVREFTIPHTCTPVGTRKNIYRGHLVNHDRWKVIANDCEEVVDKAS
jgi:hypothetical protein